MAEVDEYPSLRFQDIRKKPKCHGRTDNVKIVYPTTEFAQGITRAGVYKTLCPQQLASTSK